MTKDSQSICTRPRFGFRRERISRDSGRAYDATQQVLLPAFGLPIGPHPQCLVQDHQPLSPVPPPWIREAIGSWMI
jgi:hypothetical protein